MKVTLLFKVSHPGTGEPIKKFELVHDRPYHVFVISQDMTQFFHIHPEQRPDGTWAVDVTLPQPGYYKVLSDFLPSGGSSQFIARPIVTAGYTGDLVASSAHLEPDRELTKTIDDITAEVTYDPKQVRGRRIRPPEVSSDRTPRRERRSGICRPTLAPSDTH